MHLSVLQRLNLARRSRRGAILVTAIESGDQRLILEQDDFSADPLGADLAARFRSGKSGMIATDAGEIFFTVCVPPPRLVIIGAVHISQALAPMADLAGLDVTIIDPRTAFATRERFPQVNLVARWPDEVLSESPLDRYTGVAALTHDPKIDDVAIVEALASSCFYVGALGSKKTHAKRVERLRTQGVEQARIESIHAPIGLDIRAQSPAEIAVAILAQVIGALR
jgi:xanthine dehydrogenase accessory factor